MEMKFEASTFIEDGSLELRLNDKVILGDAGRVTAEIEQEKEYEVSWKVEGKPGTSYTISVSSPPAAEFHLRKVLGKNGTDKNQFQFET